MTDPIFPQWYGQGNLWFAPSSIYAGAEFQTLANDSVWFQGITPIVLLASQPPKITGHLANDPATSLSTSAAEGSLLPGDHPPVPAHFVSLSLPKPGCWQLSITSGSDTLNVTLWAVPIDQRPDVIFTKARVKNQMPYPAPADCAVTKWNGPADHGTPYSADFWITGQGMNIDATIPVFFAGQSSYLQIYNNLAKEPIITGRLNSMPSGVVRDSWEQYSSGNGQSGWRGTLLFSSPGCWNLSVTDGSAKVDATIYVYPADCYHTLEEPQPASCKAPA